MRTSLLLTLFTLVFYAVNAQKSTEAVPIEDSSGIYSYCQVMPSFETSKYKSFEEYISNTISYPKDALAMRKTGIVFVEFIIEIDGSVSNVKIVEGRSLYPSCDQEAIRVISNSPKWKPGMQNGEPRRIKRIQKIRFHLEG